MKLYAIEIRKSDLELITLLNGGSTPLIEKKTTFFIFDATWNSDVHNEIVTKRDFLNNYDIKKLSPHVMAVKKDS